MVTKRLGMICRKQVKEFSRYIVRKSKHRTQLQIPSGLNLRHVEIFVFWLRGDFESGSRNRLVSIIIAIVVAITVLAPVASSFADSEEDAARIERRFELRELARKIIKKVEKRVKDAADLSPTIQRNNAEMMWAINECFKKSGRQIAMLEQLAVNTLAYRRLADKNKKFILECPIRAEEENPNREILDEIRDAFIQEEIDRLFKPEEKQERKEFKQAIRKLST